MRSTPTARRPRLPVSLLTAVISIVAAALLTTPAPASAHTTTTVFNTVAGAPEIGLIGDSTLAGVRWYQDFGELRKFSFVFNAESCRRTLEPSCWSREGYRPDTALQVMQQLSARWGDVLVVMTGYDDSSYLFDDAIDALVAEARRQDIRHVLWLTLRTDGVSYEEPLHQANGRTYREGNEVLFSEAAKLDGYLQIADWATYSTGHEGWLEPDGVHLTAAGVDGLTGFIADQVGRVLVGEAVTPAEPPWYPLVQGDSGDRVTGVQQALLAAGIDLHGGVDGAFGVATAQGVAAFQRQKDLDVTGVVDQRTAIALGIRRDPRNAVPSTTVPAAAERAVPGTPPPSTDGGRPTRASDTGWTVVALVVIGFNAALALYVRSRLGARRRNRLAGEAAIDDNGAGDETGRDRQPAFGE
jgi:hypothetical protein